MTQYLGDFTEDDTIYVVFNTFTSDNPSTSCTITNFINTDVHIHKDDGLAQRNNAAGITVSIDFDGITGSHLIKIDTNDNTVAGFWVAGHDYFVRIEGTTVDAATINAFVGHFSIENRFMRGTDSAALAVDANPDIIIPIPNIPNAIDLSDSATVRIGIGITNAIGNLPTTAEITPGTIYIYQKAIGDTTWLIRVNGAACLENDGRIYYDEVFDTTSGYAAGDSIKIMFIGQKVTVNGTDHDIVGTGSWSFYTYIREEMRGTDSAATATALTTHDTKLDSIIVDVTAIDVLTEAGGLGDLTSIKTQVDAILSLERESGTPTVTGTETTLYEDAAPTKNKMGVVVKIDMAALQAGDTFVLKEKYKDESGGTYQEIDSVEYTGVQTKPLRIITLTPYRYGAIITMQKTGGTDRIIEWESFVEE